MRKNKIKENWKIKKKLTHDVSQRYFHFEKSDNGKYILTALCVNNFSRESIILLSINLYPLTYILLELEQISFFFAQGTECGHKHGLCYVNTFIWVYFRMTFTAFTYTAVYAHTNHGKFGLNNFPSHPEIWQECFLFFFQSKWMNLQ